MAALPLLLRKGRVLTPRSRLRYRLVRLRLGRTFVVGGGVGAVASVGLRVLSLPIVVAMDYALWPIVRRTLGRGPWWVVELRFHGPDAEFVRVAEAGSEDEARDKIRELESGVGRARVRRLDWLR